MADFNFNNTSLNRSYNNSNSTVENDEEDKNVKFIMHVATCIIIAIGLPLILVAIYSLYSLVRNDHVAPIYVINLLISDLIQLCCMIVKEALPNDEQIFKIYDAIHFHGMVASVGFMVCIALERYLVIAHPLWYRFRRTIKISVVVCVFVWALPLVPLLAYFLGFANEIRTTIKIALILPPFPLLIFFLGGTLKALSASKSVPTEEKRRIVGILVLVLLIYTLLFLPFLIFLFLSMRKTYFKPLFDLCIMCLRLSPLADLFLYIFMRKGAIDKLLASLCCCRMDSNDDNSSSVAMTTCTQSA